MAEFYVLDWEGKPTIVGGVEDKNTSSLANKYTRGQMLASGQLPVDLRILVEMAPDGAYPDYFTLQQIPIVSERFVRALRSVACNFDVYPAPIVENDRRVGGHYVLNVVGRVSCLDADHSEVTYIDTDSDVILRMKKLAIEPKKSMDLDLFRLQEFELLILVSRRVRDTLRGLEGLSLLPAQGWSDSAWF